MSNNELAKYQKKDVIEFPNNTYLKNPIVSVVIVTFNHVKYISECIEGVLMQKVEFPLEIIIGEDESNDGTREICIEYAKKYPDKIRLLLNSRDNNIKLNGQPTAIFNVLYSYSKVRGKYIAVCEGDDYWTDRYKLQKQVDFLETNPDYGLVFTDADHYQEREGKLICAYDKTFKRRIPIGDVLSVLLQGISPYKTCTAVFRGCLIEEHGAILSRHGFKMGDVVLWLIIAGKAKIGYINKSTAVYRIRERSASHHEDLNQFLAFRKSSYKARIFFAAYYNRPLDRKKLKQSFKKSILTYCVSMKQYKMLFKFAGCFPVALAAIFKEILRNLVVLMNKIKI
jgi:glycosyltransferase involved in cell wall biosynthesis